MITPFKFLTKSADTYPSTEMVNFAYAEGIRSFELGREINYNPFINQQTFNAFNVGWLLGLERASQDQNETSITQTIEFLIEYHRRLDYVYIFNYNVFTQAHPLYEQTSSLFTRTYDLIGRGRLRSHQQIRRHLHFGYRDIAEGASLPPFRASQATHQSIVFDTYNYITSR